MDQLCGEGNPIPHGGTLGLGIIQPGANEQITQGTPVSSCSTSGVPHMLTSETTRSGFQSSRTNCWSFTWSGNVLSSHSLRTFALDSIERLMGEKTVAYTFSSSRC